MIQYRRKDGSLGQINESPYRIETNDNTFIIIIRKYGYDEYDFWDEKITDIIELRIG